MHQSHQTSDENQLFEKVSWSDDLFRLKPSCSCRLPATPRLITPQFTLPSLSRQDLTK